MSNVSNAVFDIFHSDFNGYKGIDAAIEELAAFHEAKEIVEKKQEFLMKDKNLENYYNWVTGMKNAPYTDVIEGRYVARQVDENISMEIGNKSTYYKVEKGTDINLAVHAISKAFYNSYDIAFFLSADTDYIKVYEVLKSIGKITVVVGVKGQNVNSIRPIVDNTLILDEKFFDRCKRDAVVRH